MVDRAVADAALLHAADHLLKGLQVVGGVAVHLDVADVAGVGEGVVGRLDPDLVVGGDGVVHRHVEGVGVVLPVGDPLDGAVPGPVQLDEPAGQALRRGGQQGEVQPPLLALLIHPRPHVGDDLQAQHLGLLALPVVDADEGLQGLRQADEAHGQGAVLEHLPHLVLPVQLVAVQPHPLAHEEGVVVHVLAALDLKSLQQLIHAQIQHPVQALEEGVQIPPGLDGQPGQVDGGEAQVAPAVADLPAGVVHVADDPGAAAHVGDLRLRMAGLVVLEVKGRVDEGEVGEQPLGGAPHGQLEQVVVGLAGVVVDALLHPEDLDGEDGGLAAAQAGLGGQHHVLHHHAALGGGVHAVVDGGEGGLGPGPGVHGVQVVDQGLHGLVGGPVGLLHRPLVGEPLGLLNLFLGAEGGHQNGPLGGEVVPAVLQGGGQAGVLLNARHDALQLLLGILPVLQQHEGPGQVLAVHPAEGLAHAVGHAVVEVDHALAAVLVVLVGLDGDAAQGGVGGDVVGLPQGAVAGGEAAGEQLFDVDLAAGGGEGQKVQIVDVDVPLPVGAGVVGVEDEHIVELLGALGAELEHGAHGGVAVDVGVLPLDVGVLGLGEGDVLVGLHQAGIHLPGAAALLPVEDIGLGGLDIAVVHEHPFHQILDMLHAGLTLPLHLQDGEHLVGQLAGHVLLPRLVGGGKGLVDGGGDFLLVEVGQPAVPLADLGQCHGVSFLSLGFCPAKKPKQGGAAVPAWHYILWLFLLVRFL